MIQSQGLWVFKGLFGVAFGGGISSSLGNRRKTGLFLIQNYPYPGMKWVACNRDWPEKKERAYITNTTKANLKGDRKMEWLKEVLKGLQNAQELEKKITEGIGKNFVARSDFNALNSTKKSLEGQVLQLQEESAKEGNLKQRLEDLERKIALEKEDAMRKEREAAQDAYLKKRFDEVVGENQWRDALTEKGVFDQFKTAISLEVNRGKEDGVIFEELTKDKNYFLNPNRPVDMLGMGHVSMTKMEENKMRGLMGLSLKD